MSRASCTGRGGIRTTPLLLAAYPGASFVERLLLGRGRGHCGRHLGLGPLDWHRHDIDIDVNKWNEINGNRVRRSLNNTWALDPAIAALCPTSDKATREKYGQADARPRPATRNSAAYDEATRIAPRSKRA